MIPCVERELREWPGVTHRYQDRGKHRSIVFRFEGRELFYVTCRTPSDSYHGQRNMIAGVRVLLRELGAERRPRPRSVRDRFFRHRPEPLRHLKSVVFEGRLAQNPFEKLRGMFR